MTRTLVISDTHLGGIAGRGVLERPEVRAVLMRELEGVDRLILLGDLLELEENRPEREVMSIAARVLTDLGRRVSEVVLIPGNHDRALIRPWLLDVGAGLPLESEVPVGVSPLLSETAELLGAGGAQVEVHYPGYRFSEDVWMTHGHLLDRLLWPTGPYGLLPRPPALTPAGYEPRAAHPRRPAVVRLLSKQLLTPRMAPLTAAALNLQLRRHSLPALARGLTALGVRASYVVFGHVHRLGPRLGDPREAWQYPLAPGQTPTHFINTGSWQQESLLLGHRRPPHPYWPGGGVLIETGGIPRPVNLLESSGLPAPAPRQRRRGRSEPV